MGRRVASFGPKFCQEDYPVDAAYYTFKENLLDGYSLNEIRAVLSHHALEESQIDAGFERLVFTMTQFIRAQEQESRTREQIVRYLQDRGYTDEIINIGFERLNQKHH